MKRVLCGLTCLALLMGALGSKSYAGPFILSGTDADDHGFVSGGANMDGWLFMQKVLENLAPGVTNGNKKVVALGSSAGTALSAATSAFTLSTLPGLGWTFASVDGVTDITDFFSGAGTHNTSNTGIIMMDSAGNTSGGTSGTELAVFTANAAAIDSFLGAGGGLFSQSNGYGWVSVLVPGLTTPGAGDTGIALTAAGMAAFPGLTDADLSAGPFHNYFAGIGAIPVLGVDSGGSGAGTPVIIGSSGGSVSDPDPVVPEPASIALFSLGAMGLGVVARRRKQQSAA